MDSGYLGGVSVDIDSKKKDWEPPPASVPRSLFFPAETLGQITVWQFISLLMNRSMIRC